MKNLFGLVAVVVSASAFAQSNEGPPATHQKGDVVEIVSLDKMPLPLPPGEAVKMRGRSSSKAPDGFTTVEIEPTLVKGFYNHMNAAKTYIARKSAEQGKGLKGDPSMPEIHKDLTTLKLSFKAASLNRGRIIAAAPSGTRVNETWTGVDRFFQIDGVGSVKLSEQDLVTSGGKFYMMKEAVNTRVRGNPAISKVFIDDDGQTIEEVLWVNGGKLSILTFGPDMQPGTKNKAAPHINANFLVQELN